MLRGVIDMLSLWGVTMMGVECVKIITMVTSL